MSGNDRDLEGDDYLARGLRSAIRRHRDEHPQPQTSRDDAPPTDPSELPTHLDGRPVLSLIGRGGVGLVYRVRDEELDRELALKVLSRRFANDPQMVQQFEAEAAICAQLQHPGIVPVHERGELEDGRPFFTMKVVEGTTLAERLAARDNLAETRLRFLEIMERICLTVAYAHSQSIVHGDIKPGNVMVGSFGEVQLMDWGFARHTANSRPDSPSESRAAQHVMGTPAYMAPEQARGTESGITIQTDVFGLGAILCEVLTGRPPYEGDTRSATRVEAAQGWTDKARDALDDCGADAAMTTLAKSCLESDPGQRPKDAAAVGTVIRTYLTGLETRARTLEMQAVAAEAKRQQERRSNRLALALAITVLLTLTIATTVIAWMRVEGADRRINNQHLLAQQVERTRRLFSEAQKQPPEDTTKWPAAVAASQQAEEFARVKDMPPDSRRQARELAASIADASRSADRVLNILNWVEQTRPHYSDDRSGVLSLAYQAGFQRFGFATTDKEQFARQIRQSPIKSTLWAAIDDWARVARVSPHRGPNWQTLVDIARAIDKDPFRDRLRIAFRDNNLDELRALSTSSTLTDEAPATINLLGKCLFDLGAVEESVEALSKGVTRYPSDFWMLHDLSAFLRRTKNVSNDKLIGLCRAAAAARPNDPHALADLVLVLAFRGDQWGQAGTVVDHILEKFPNYHRPWFSEVLVLNGRIHEGREQAAANAEARNTSATLEVVSWAAAIQGEWKIGAGYLRRASELAPEQSQLHWKLASLLASDGQLEEAKKRTKRALIAYQQEHDGAATGLDGLDDSEKALVLLADATALPTDLQTPPVRAIAKFHSGDMHNAATELRDWLATADSKAEFAHFEIGAQAAMACSREANVDTQHWQLLTLQLLHAAIETTATTRKLALNRLRWLQWNPNLSMDVWLPELRGKAREFFKALELKIRLNLHS